MGRDKYENEDLIKYGIPLDIWYVLDQDSPISHVTLRALSRLL